MYTAFNITIHGTSHIKEGLPCEDNSSRGNNFIAIADGHGDRRVCRARDGAALACLVAEDQLMKQTTFTAAADKIVSEWNEEVAIDLQTYPLSASEKECTIYTGPYMSYCYGTTLLAARIADGKAQLLQLGDGEIIAVTNEGHLIYPMPEDERCVDNKTSSLCEENARDLMRLVEIDSAAAVFICSDGFIKAFEYREWMNSWVRSILCELIKEEPDIQEIACRLRDISNHGPSQDDVSIAVLVDKSKMEELTPVFIIDDAHDENVYKKKALLPGINERILSIQRSGRLLNNEDDEGKEKYARLLARREALLAELTEAERSNHG